MKSLKLTAAVAASVVVLTSATAVSEASPEALDTLCAAQVDGITSATPPVRPARRDTTKTKERKASKNKKAKKSGTKSAKRSSDKAQS